MEKKIQLQIEMEDNLLLVGGEELASLKLT